MKILFVLQSINRIGGTEKATIDQANMIAENSDHEVIILSLYKNVKDKFSVSRNISSKIRIINFFEHLTLLNFPDIFYRVLELFIKSSISKVINEINPDYIIYTAIKLYVKSNAKSILMIHFSYEHYLTGNVTRNIFNRCYNEFYKIIFLTQKDLELYENDKRINNGVYIPNFCLLEPQARSSLNNSIITYVGRLDNSQKQLNKLIEIVKVLANQGLFKDRVLHIYGSGPDNDEIQEQISSNILTEYVILKGSSNDLEYVYSNSDIVVLTSKYEGLPLCLIEATLSGIPIISFDCAPGISMIVEDDYNGFVIEPNDINNFANKLSLLMNNNEMRFRFGANSLNLGKSKFSTSATLKKWFNIFNL